MSLSQKVPRKLRLFQTPTFRICLISVLVFVILFVAVWDESLTVSIQNLIASINANQPSETKLSTRPDWSFTASTPDFCKKILAKPMQYAWCRPDPKYDWETTRRCEDGNVTMMSQFGQDYYLYTRHFSFLKRRGIYLDVAANEPTFISNTYFLDACLGWDGICVEANPTYHDKLKKQRTCKLIDTCVSDQEGERVKFILGGGYGGIADTNKNTNTWLKKDGIKTGEIDLKCTTMGRVLRENNIAVVDYISLDVEGHEMKVLKGFDWERLRFNVMTLELSGTKGSELNAFLKEKGYVRHIPTLNEHTKKTGTVYGDAVFLHESVTFGDPK